MQSRQVRPAAVDPRLPRSAPDLADKLALLAVPFIVLALSGTSFSVAAQDAPSTGLEFAGLPVLKVDSDDGWTYGALAELYQYGDGTRSPYQWTIQPRVELSTEGRRDATLFVDAPHVLPEGWRVNGFLGIERRIVTPYYGLGNDAPYDRSLEAPAGPNPNYYEFGSLRRSALFNLQRNLPNSPLWALFGAGLVSTRVDPSPEDVGTTLYAADNGPAVETYWSNYIRAGLVWDTRDRETAPRDGSWSEVVVHWATESLGADSALTRWSITDRRYYSLSDQLVFAHRFYLQGVSGGPPAHELQRLQTSFKQGEGLGGAKTVRGLPKNRYAGRGMLVWNAELRLHVFDFGIVGRRFHLAVSAFVDHGRVWKGGVRPEELLSDLHRGYGGGLHVGMGENFVASLDVAHSSEATLPFYMGLGYLY